MFTNEELILLDKLIRAVPLQGTIETLPQAMSQMAELLRKINQELQDRSDAASYMATHPSDPVIQSPPEEIHNEG